MTKIKRKTAISLGVLLITLMLLLCGFATGFTAFADNDCQHEYVITVYEPKCTEKGYTEYVCSECGYSYKDDYTNETGHVFTDTLTRATCTEKGYLLHVCDACGYTYKEAVEDETGHEYSEFTVLPDCTHKGYVIHICNACGYQYTDGYTDETGHDFTVTVFEPTCVSQGYTHHVCNACGFKYNDNITEKLAHEYEVETVEATCTEDGYTVFRCDACGDEYVSDIVPQKGHSYTENIVAPTCVAYGYTEHVCEYCGSRRLTDFTYPTGHYFTVETVEPTDTDIGYTSHACRVCGYAYLDNIVASGSGDEYKNIQSVPIPQDEEPNGQGEGLIGEQGNPTNVDPNNEPTEQPSDNNDESTEHTHIFVLNMEVDENLKLMQVEYGCNCGENNTENLKAEFISENSVAVVFVPDENGCIDFSALEGQYTVIITNEFGDVLMIFDIELKENDEQAAEPETPDNPAESDQTNDGEIEAVFGTGENEVFENKDKPDTTEAEEDRGNSGLITGIVITLMLLAAGAVLILILIKKKNKKGKENNKQ